MGRLANTSRTTSLTRLALLLCLLGLSACPGPGPQPFPDDACVPMSCEGAGKQCGTAPDGCGGTLECGGCPEGQVCGGKGYQNICVPGDCQPQECPANGCGQNPDGCGNTVECGECTDDKVCRSNGELNICVPPGCELANCPESSCGEYPDGCGGTMSCGGCPEPNACSAPTEGVCSCGGESDAQLCALVFKNCGTVTAADLCGEIRTVECGECAEPQSCGGGGIANLCGCRPKTCAQLGACGQVFDGCSRTLDCGCAAPDSCGGGGVEGMCGCTPIGCADQGVGCGEAYDGCGQMIDCGTCPSGTSPPRLALRVMAANTSSGNRQSYDPGEGIRIFQGLKPDVVLIQEFNYGANDERSIRSMVESAFGSRFYHSRELDSQIPNGVISRYPIVQSGEWTDTRAANRDFAWARIDLPGPRDLWVVSVHFLTTSSGDRASEAHQVVTKVEQVVPADDYLVIGGDFNTSTRGESAISTLRSVVVTAGPYPADHRGNTNTNANRSSPYDWLTVDDDLDAHARPVVIGSRTFDDGLVFDSRIYTPLSEVAPILRDDSDALNMQHMAVVRDFQVPRR